MKKNIIGILIIMVFTLTIFSQVFAMNKPPTATTTKATVEMTKEELAKFTGKNGTKAYIAVDNVIYDVTTLSSWFNGAHKGYNAGQDLTQAFKNDSPHTSGLLKQLPVVGKLVTTKTVVAPKATTPVVKPKVTTPAVAPKATTPVVTTSAGITLTELAKFNGQNGQPAYIAVNGTVYDVTKLSSWFNGSHKGYKAGQDLTQAFNNDSPHTSVLLKQLPVIGVLAQTQTSNSVITPSAVNSQTQINKSSHEDNDKHQKDDDDDDHDEKSSHSRDNDDDDDDDDHDED